MGQLRTVACTSCGTERTTKANRGVALVCTGCGGKFTAPGPELEPQELKQPAAPAPANGVRVTRGAPRIPQRARPRARAGELEQQPAPELEPTPAPQPAPLEVQRAAGRRGGLARYASWRLSGG